MAQLSANTCNILTLFPLGAVCNSTNAYTNESFDGSIEVLISGGTSPYTTTWSNGAQGTTIDNLQSGTYTATTVDFFGDFTATTVCTVGYDTYYLDVFESCSTSGSYLFYSSQTPTIFVTDSVYGLVGQNDCYTFTGRTLYSSQTVQSGYAQILSGPFVDCSNCVPAPTPPPTFTEYICLTKSGEFFEQYTFQTGATVNGYPTYLETGSTTYGMYYSSSNLRWEMTGWTTGVPAQTGNMVQSFSSITPLGGWSQLGTVNTWTVTAGVCTPQQLNIVLDLNDPSCAGSNDGIVVINAAGGPTPYTYSLDGINYQSSAVFTNLGAGTGYAYAKDANGTVYVEPYTLVNATTAQTYVLTLTPNPGTPINTNTVSTKSLGYTVSISPPLATNETVTFNLTLVENNSAKNNGIQSPSLNVQQSVPTVSSGNISLATNTTSQTGPTVRACGGTEGTTGTTKVYIVALTGNGTLSGTLSSTMTTPLSTVASCPTVAGSVTQVSISNVQISTPLCNNINTGVMPITLNNTKTGLISTGPSSKSWNIVECAGGTCSGGLCACSTQTSRTVYTLSSVTNITALTTEIYENATLTNPYTADFQYNGKIWNSSGSVVTLVCNIGGPC